MKHKMPPLKYQEDALSPKMSAETLQFHHGKHEQTYFNTMNTLIEGTEYENMSLEDIVKKSDGKLFNNAAQSWNHVFFFDQFSANPQPRPSGNIAGAIEDQFGSFEGFKKNSRKQVPHCSVQDGSGYTGTIREILKFPRNRTQAILSNRAISL